MDKKILIVTILSFAILLGFELSKEYIFNDNNEYQITHKIQKEPISTYIIGTWKNGENYYKISNHHINDDYEYEVLYKTDNYMIVNIISSNESHREIWSTNDGILTMIDPNLDKNKITADDYPKRYVKID